MVSEQFRILAREVKTVSDAESVTMASLAVDAGGTSTRAVVVDHAGRCLGAGRAGAGNPVSAGWPAAAAALAEACGQALTAAGLAGETVGRVVVAMAGGNHGGEGQDARRLGEALASLQVSAPVVVENDLLGQYCSGSWTTEGYALVAGTGAAAIRVEDGRAARTADGLGWLLGDLGSGFWIGQRVVHAVLAAAEGRGRPTALTELLVAEPGIGPLGDGSRALPLRLVDLLYAAPPVRLARFAPLAFAADGDPVADSIVRGAGDALCTTLGAVLQDEVQGPVVLGGSVLMHQERVRRHVEDHLSSLGRCAPVTVVPDGLLGAAVLALRHAGVTVDEATFSRARSTLAGLR